MSDKFWAVWRKTGGGAAYQQYESDTYDGVGSTFKAMITAAPKG